MKTFSLKLHDTNGSEHIQQVISFVAEDDSGSFGIQAYHARFMTSLNFGLARYRCNEDIHGDNYSNNYGDNREHSDWHYLALPGGILYFDNNILTINTRRYLLDDNFERISQALQERLLSEERKLEGMKGSIRHMEKELLKRMWQYDRGRP